MQTPLPLRLVVAVTATPGIGEATLLLNLAAALADTGGVPVAIVDHVGVQQFGSVTDAEGLQGITIVAGPPADLAAVCADYSFALIRVATTNPCALQLVGCADEGGASLAIDAVRTSPHPTGSNPRIFLLFIPKVRLSNLRCRRQRFLYPYIRCIALEDDDKFLLSIAMLHVYLRHLLD